VTIDFELFERNNNYFLEVGITKTKYRMKELSEINFDTKQIYNEVFIIGQPVTEHYIFKNNLHVCEISLLSYFTILYI
jgi:hypothetical protein